MALVTYDVTASVVLKHLIRFNVSGAAHPGPSDITSEWINLSAAEVEDAMLEGGFSSSEVDSTNEPSAYYQLRHLVAERAAIHYLRACANFANTDFNRSRWEYTETRLQSIREGRRIGELTVTDGLQSIKFYHDNNNDSDDDLDAVRAAWDDEL